MSAYLDRMRRLMASEDGPTAVEYAMMLALIVVVCVGRIWFIGIQTWIFFDRLKRLLYS